MTAAATFNADAARAARREALAEPFTFTWTGRRFTLPPAREWPLQVMALLAKPDIVGAMQVLLGDQWDAYAAGDPTLADVEAIMEAVGQWQGAGTLPE